MNSISEIYCLQVYVYVDAQDPDRVAQVSIQFSRWVNFV